MGCVNTKHAVSVTPAFDLSGVFPDNESTAMGNSGLAKTKGSGEFGESGRASSNGGGGNETLSFRLGNFNRFMEGEQVAAGWPAWLSAVAGEAIQGWVPLRSDAYEKLEKIGQGTYSSVFRARELETGRIVALKKVRFDNFEPESVRFMAREIMILRRLDHPNIIKLEGLITSRLSCSIYLVFEYMDHDITGLLSCPDITFSESQIKCYMKQLLSGLEHCHSRGVMHRDIKGSNLLVNNEGVLKVADFGLANFCNSGHRQPLTSRVITLWYRPPELLLGSTDYNASVDLWSVGCVFAELLVGKPILQGRTEVEQLHKIFKLCGSPPDEYWKKSKLPHATLFKPQHPYNTCLRQTFKDYPPTTVHLLETLLSVEPYKRGVASSALTSEYFSTKPYACDPSSMPIYPPSKEIDAKQREESRRKKGSGRSRGLDSKRLARKHLGISKLAPAEDLSASSRHLHEVSTNVQNVNEETAIKGGETQKPSIDRLEESMHVRNASQGDIPFSGPLRVSTSSGFAWARRRRDEASIRSHLRTISRGHLINGLDHAAILQSRSNVDSKFHEKGDMSSISRSSSKGHESNERSKVVIRNQWSKFAHTNSFDTSANPSKQLSPKSSENQEILNSISTTNPISSSSIMLSLKQTSIMAATFHVPNPFSSSSPSKTLPFWLRSVSATANAAVRRRNSLRPPPPPGGGDRDSVIHGGGAGWWTLAPRARLVLDKSPNKILGFRCGYKCFSMRSKRFNSDSFEKRGGVFGSGSDSASPQSSGSEFVADMGSESKDHNNNGWFRHDLLSQTQSPLMHQQDEPQQRSKLLTLPTMLTLARVAAVPILVCTFYVDNWWGTTATTSIFIAAAVTDWLDGYIARKMRLSSAFGAFLDPVADKLMVAATLILLCTQPLEVSVFGHVPWLLTLPSIAIIGREITMSAVREWAASQNSKLLEAVAVNNLGKWKTATQMVALTTLLASRDSSIGGSGAVVATGVVLLYISAWLAVWSLFVYSRKISKALLR